MYCLFLQYLLVHCSLDFPIRSFAQSSTLFNPLTILTNLQSTTSPITIGSACDSATSLASECSVLSSLESAFSLTSTQPSPQATGAAVSSQFSQLLSQYSSLASEDTGSLSSDLVLSTSGTPYSTITLSFSTSSPPPPLPSASAVSREITTEAAAATTTSRASSSEPMMFGQEKRTEICPRGHLTLTHPAPLYQHLLSNAGEY